MTELDRQVGVVWCPAEGDDCEQAHAAEAGGSLREVERSPDRQSLAFFRMEPSGGACELVVCYDHACAAPAEAACNPNNGSLRWLPSGNLLYRGSGGSGISVAALYARDGTTRWSSVHVADEVSPSQRYLLVGLSTTQQLFADIDTLEVLDLESGETLATQPVQAGANVHALWADARLRLTWPGGARDVALTHAGVLRGDDGDWRPFSR